MSLAAPASIAPAPKRQLHIVDVLIAERAPRLARSPAWPLLRPLLYAVLDYGKARRMADAIAPMTGSEALGFVSDLLSLRVTATGVQQIPTTGRCVVICNHPTGIADGVAVYDALKAVRPDICFYANADAQRVCARFEDVLIPVEWVEAKRTRERLRTTLTMTRQAMEAGRCLVIFPAGRISRRQADGSIRDKDWAASAVSIARKYEAPVVQVHVTGPWSTLFHAFDQVSQELRDITLFHELLNKQSQPFTLTIGADVAPAALDGDPATVTARLKTYVERDLPARPDRPFA